MIYFFWKLVRSSLRSFSYLLLSTGFLLVILFCRSGCGRNKMEVSLNNKRNLIST
jgi:hypothetical protein